MGNKHKLGKMLMALLLALCLLLATPIALSAAGTTPSPKSSEVTVYISNKDSRDPGTSTPDTGPYDKPKTDDKVLTEEIFGAGEDVELIAAGQEGLVLSDLPETGSNHLAVMALAALSVFCFAGYILSNETGRKGEIT